MTSSEKVSEIRAIRVTTGWDCNLECPYCTQRHSLASLKAKDSAGSLQLVSLYGLLKHFGERLVKDGTLSIELEGGEPLLHPDVLVGAVKLCGQVETETRGICYKLFTNARLLNEEPSRELVRWIKKRGRLVLAPSFDHHYKRPALLHEDAYRFMAENSDQVFGTYVIEGKRFLDEAKENIRYLNERGIKPRVLWNFYAYEELADGDVRRAFAKLLQEADVFRNQGWEGTVSRCGWIGISPKGRFYPCYQSVLGDIDLAEGKEFERTHCAACPYKSYCRQCLARKAYFKENLCHYVRAMHEAEKGKEAEGWPSKTTR